MASSLECPSAMRLATYAFVFGSVRRRTIAMMCRALLAARSPPRLQPMPDRLAGGGRDRAHTAECGKACFGSQALRVIASREQKLCGAGMADRVAGNELWSELVDDGVDHGVEIGNLVMQFEIPPPKGFQRDPVGGGHIAEIGEIWPPRRQRPDELHAGHVSQRLPQVVWRADDRVVDHL